MKNKFTLSNRNIFQILLLTLIITLIGTTVNVNKLFHIAGNSMGSLTGAASTNAIGSSTITVSQSTSITDDFTVIQFGSGFVNASCTVCNMDSDGVITQGCCGTFNRTNNRGFLLENTGNVNLSVNYTCLSSCNSTTFVGGTSPAFQIKTTNNSVASQSGEVGAADTAGACFGQGVSGLNFTSYKDVSAAGDWLCGNSTTYPFESTDTKDAFVVDLNVSVPADAPTGSQKSALFTFNALATG